MTMTIIRAPTVMTVTITKTAINNHDNEQQAVQNKGQKQVETDKAKQVEPDNEQTHERTNQQTTKKQTCKQKRALFYDGCSNLKQA